MQSFTYSYPVKVYFGEKAAEKNLPAELAKVGENVLLAYGGGSIKKIGLPTSFAEISIPEDTDFKAVADSTFLMPGCAKKFTKEELLEVLLECR